MEVANLLTLPVQDGPATELIQVDYTASPMPCLINGTYYDASAFVSQNWTDAVAVHGFGNENQTLYVPKECYFGVAGTVSLWQYLPQFLDGYVMRAPETYYSTPSWLGGLYGVGGNVTLEIYSGIWAAIADSITVQMRETPDHVFNSTALQGVAWHTEACISVQWPWISFTIALVVLSAVFLLATIVQTTCYSNLQIWKSSPLAFLFSGLQDSVRDKYRNVESMDEMEEYAKSLFLRLEQKDDGYRFVQNSA